MIGPQRRGLTEILKETGVSVEVPTEEEDSDTITLRGDPAKLGEALALVYAKASSVITSEISCEHWMHKFLIGPKGSTLQVCAFSTRTFSFILLMRAYDDGVFRCSLFSGMKRNLDISYS